jgi:8-oxo-dGTP pyrophosphatase MutT (NUDIX family)
VTAPAFLDRLLAEAPTMAVPPVLRPPAGGARAAAVLILFGEGAHGPDLLLIQRADTLRKHPGQPAFPGGAIDPDDDGPVGAALREAAEETGLDPAGVEVLTTLPELYVSRSEFRVTPVVGWWREPSDVGPVDPGEVASVARVPISDLIDPANRLQLRGPAGYISAAFQVGGMLVWGFTAGLLDGLLAVGGWERPWDTSRIEDLPASVLDLAVGS